MSLSVTLDFLVELGSERQASETWRERGYNTYSRVALGVGGRFSFFPSLWKMGQLRLGLSSLS